MCCGNRRSAWRATTGASSQATAARRAAGVRLNPGHRAGRPSLGQGPKLGTAHPGGAPLHGASTAAHLGGGHGTSL